MQAGRLTPVAAQHNIVDSLLEATRVAGFPLLITTADNVLMTVEGLHSIAERGSDPSVDGVIMMAREDDIMAAHPEGQRRFYRFRDGGFSNCNLFWISGRERPSRQRDASAMAASSPRRRAGRSARSA